ncbi:unannotated protein [freshwater metagenome]|uniref:Unannotated protein n=1 Tax=freshwater metagenome TaxID=449393 RepID=A0A6J7FNF9_9ZZZZ|nr:hypothetical protein [Actinomycetota bacterium]
MTALKQLMTEGHPTEEAFDRARKVVLELPSEPTPGQLWDWCAAVREAVTTLCEEVPGGGGGGPTLDLCILVARGPRAAPTVGADGAPRTIIGFELAEIDAYRERLSSALTLVGQWMQRGVDSALKSSMGVLEDMSVEDVASLLDTDVDVVRKLRDDRLGYVYPPRVIVIRWLLTGLLLRRQPGCPPDLHWFWEPSDDFDGRRPVDLLDEDPWRHRELLMSVMTKGMADPAE